MEDRDVSGYEDHSISGQLSATLHDHAVTSQELSKLCAILSSALPGGDTTASGLPGISIPRLDNKQLLQPPALGQDWALGSTIPRYRCLPTENYAIAMDYGLFDKKLPVTIAMSGVGGGHNWEPGRRSATAGAHGTSARSAPLPVWPQVTARWTQRSLQTRQWGWELELVISCIIIYLTDH